MRIHLTLDHKTKTSFQTVAFYFSPNEKLHFIAGQYLQLIIPHDSDERGSSRFFSIASAPEEKHIMITIKEGESSFKKRLFALEKGDEIEAFGPMGQFILEDQSLISG